MKDKYFSFILLIGLLYVYSYLFLVKNISFWISDLRSCFSQMSFFTFLENHINIFAYIFIFAFMSLFLLRAVLISINEIINTYNLLKVLEKRKLKKYKNLYIIEDDDPLAFNLLNKVFISTGFIRDIPKEQLRAVFYHEIGHLKNFHSLKLFIANFVFYLIPLLKKFQKNMLLYFETTADKMALDFVNSRDLAYALLNVKNIESKALMMNSFTLERLNIILENKNVKLPKGFYIVLFVIFVIILIFNIYKTCFCGLM